MHQLIIFHKKVRIHYSLILVLILSLYIGKYIEILSLLCILLLHEIGHIFFMIIFNQRLSRITITAVGGVIDVDYNISNTKQLIVNLGGLIVNVILYIVLYFYDCEGSLFNYNRLILLVNSLPIYPLDGNRVLSNILNYFKPKALITRILLFISTCFLSLFLLYNIINKNFGLLLIGIYLIYRNVCFYVVINDIIVKKIINSIK